MAPFDPASVHKAVAEFTPRRPQKFQDLAPAKEVIIELRKKRASYRAIAELLTQHCLPTSKTAIAAFCHEILGEIIRPKRRTKRRPLPLAATNGNGNGEPTLFTQPASQPAKAGDTTDPKKAEVQGTRKRGPRIAQVRMIKKEGS
jgi:hypothetical protein